MIGVHVSQKHCVDICWRDSRSRQIRLQLAEVRSHEATSASVNQHGAAGPLQQIAVDRCRQWGPPAGCAAECILLLGADTL
jgi:hypothetical protein